MLIALLFALTLDPPPLPAGAPLPATSTDTTSATVATPSATTAAPPPPAETAEPRPQTQSIIPPILRLPRAEEKPQKDLRFVWRDHPSLRAGDNFRIDFSFKFQLDGRDPGDDPIDFETWEIHRLRAGIQGELFEKIQFEVEREFKERELEDPNAASEKTAWKDVYVELNLDNAFQFRVGRFKIPFGLDVTSGEADLDFVYRSQGGNYLSPSRDLGAMAHGRFFGRKLNYWFGGFEHDGDNSQSSKIAGGDLTFAGRATVIPVTGVEFGGSYATTQVSDESLLPNGLRGRTVMSQYTFFEPMFVKGTRRRYGVDLDLTSGPFGARAEYMFVGDERQGQGLSGQDLSNVRARAWYVLGTWVLTGEKKERPVAANEGGLLRGGMGAIELAARYDTIRFDSEQGNDTAFRNSRAETIYPNGNKVTTLGLTYYANRFVKMQVNGIREQVEDKERSPIVDGSSWWSLVFRLQFQI